MPLISKDVRLLNGPFRDAMERDEKFLLSLEPERFLHMFKITAGLPSDAKPYGGWEAPDVELRGHSLGHYLSALSLMYASTGNAAFKSRAESIVAELAKIQEAMPSQGISSRISLGVSGGILRPRRNRTTRLGLGPVLHNSQDHGRTAGCLSPLR